MYCFPRMESGYIVGTYYIVPLYTPVYHDGTVILSCFDMKHRRACRAAALFRLHFALACASSLLRSDRRPTPPRWSGFEPDVFDDPVLKREVARSVKEGENDFMPTPTWDTMLMKFDTSGRGPTVIPPSETALERRDRLFVECASQYQG